MTITKSIQTAVSLLIIFTAISCTSKVDHRRAPCFDGYDYENELEFCILPVENNGTVGYACYDIESLYYDWNIKICSRKEFDNQIKRHVLKNIPITVDDEFIRWAPMIVKDSAMFQEYKTKGIQSLIEKYDHKDYMEDENCRDLKRFDYFVYLCWQEGYYVTTNDELRSIEIVTKNPTKVGWFFRILALNIEEIFE